MKLRTYVLAFAISVSCAAVWAQDSAPAGADSANDRAPEIYPNPVLPPQKVFYKWHERGKTHYAKYAPRGISNYTKINEQGMVVNARPVNDSITVLKPMRPEAPAANPAAPPSKNAESPAAAAAAGAASGAAEAATTLRRRRGGVGAVSESVSEAAEASGPSSSTRSAPEAATPSKMPTEPDCSAAGAWAGAAAAAVTRRRRRGAGALRASAPAWSCSCDSVDSDVVRRAMGLALSEADAVVVPSTHQRGCAPEREQRKSLRSRPVGRLPCLTSTQTGLAAAQLGRRKVLGQGRSEGVVPGTGTKHPKPNGSIPHMRR